MRASEMEGWGEDDVCQSKQVDLELQYATIPGTEIWYASVGVRHIG